MSLFCLQFFVYICLFTIFYLNFFVYNFLFTFVCLLFSVEKNEINLYYQACKILLECLIGKLRQHQVQPGEGAPTLLTTKQLLLPIRALCMGQSLLTKAEEVVLVAIMRSAKLPTQETKSSTSGDKDTAEKRPAEPKTPQKETKRSRTDLSSTILEQLIMPLQDFSTNFSSEPVAENASKVATDNANNEHSSDVKVRTILKNQNKIAKI